MTDIPIGRQIELVSYAGLCFRQNRPIDPQEKMITLPELLWLMGLLADMVDSYLMMLYEEDSG